MAKNIFLGALPDYDGGYRDTPEGEEGTIPQPTFRTSDVTRTDSAPSPMYQQYVPPADAPSGSGTPNPTDTPTGGGESAQGGSSQSETPTDTGADTGADDAGTGFKLSTPILLLGAAAIYFFFFRKKQ